MKKLGKAYKEVFRIIEHSEISIQNKIPKKFINVIKSAMLEEYEPEFDYKKNINNQNLMPETYAIMAIIYRDFICGKEQKKILLEEEKNCLRKIEKEKREKYNPDNIFKKNNKKEIINETKNHIEESIIPYKQSILKRIIEKLKKF